MDDMENIGKKIRTTWAKKWGVGDLKNDSFILFSKTLNS